MISWAITGISKAVTLISVHQNKEIDIKLIQGNETQEHCIKWKYRAGWFDWKLQLVAKLQALKTSDTIH
jgi:hypothetical protein